MQTANQFVLFGLDRSDRKVFYTGRAGDGWVSTNEAEAFTYATYEAAKAKADRHNAYSPLHGIHFIADCGR